MGPTSKVLLESDDESTLDTIDSVLAAVAEHMVRTRKGRVWDVRVEGRPVHVWIEDSALYLSAGCNDPKDYAILQRLSTMLASTLEGVASDPVK